MLEEVRAEGGAGARGKEDAGTKTARAMGRWIEERILMGDDEKYCVQRCVFIFEQEPAEESRTRNRSDSFC